MTRYNQELRNRGYKLECDYPWLPFEQGNITIEAVNTEISDNRIVIITVYNVGCGLEFLYRNFNVVDRDSYRKEDSNAKRYLYPYSIDYGREKRNKRSSTKNSEQYE